VLLLMNISHCASVSRSPNTGGAPLPTARDYMYARYGREAVKKFLPPDLFTSNHIIAYYGHPKSKIMGIVGRLGQPDLAKTLKEKAALYDAANGDKGIVPAIYLIYGTCQPGGNINIMKPEMVRSYIDFALANGFLVYIDHQIGKYSLEHAMNMILPFLKYPNVHLAIDLEWRTTRPMLEIGSITGDELNRIQAMMKKYMAENDIPGVRQLVFHQFHAKMVRNISKVKAEYNPVLLVHATSGWGSPEAKLSTHARNAKASNIPYKAFKLWYFYSDKKVFITTGL